MGVISDVEDIYLFLENHFGGKNKNYKWVIQVLSHLKFFFIITLYSFKYNIISIRILQLRTFLFFVLSKVLKSLQEKV